MAKVAVLETKPLTQALRQELAHPSKMCGECPLVLVCRKCDDSSDVIAFLHKKTRANVRTVRCQKVCESPVAGLMFRGRMEWFERMDSGKALKALAGLLDEKPPKKLSKTLKKRRSKQRSGCLPR